MGKQETPALANGCACASGQSPYARNSCLLLSPRMHMATQAWTFAEQQVTDKLIGSIRCEPDSPSSKTSSFKTSSFIENYKVMEIHLGDIGNIIQLAIAPVFLLTGVGGNLLVLTNRLARIIDRSRILEDRIHDATDSRNEEYLTEIEILYRRAHLINGAITLSTTCALLICVVIAALFVGGALGLDLASLIAMLFVVAMLALIGSFIYLLREIFIATGTLSMRRVPVNKS